MAGYYKPWYYTVSHVVFGFISAWYSIVGILVLIYQLGQFLFNVRVFPVERQILPGNSVNHTLKKLAEIGIGYSIGHIMKSMA